MTFYSSSFTFYYKFCKFQIKISLKQFLIIFHTEQKLVFLIPFEKKKKKKRRCISNKTDTIFVEEFFNCSIIASDSTLSSSLYRHPLHSHLHHPSKCKCHSLSSTPWGRSAAFPAEANAPLCRLLCLVATF